MTEKTTEDSAPTCAELDNARVSAQGEKPAKRPILTLKLGEKKE